MLPLCMLAGLGPDSVGDEPSPWPTALKDWLDVLIEGEWLGGEALEMLSERVTMWLSGDVCGMFSAVGCSVPMLVTPESPALPALERA